MALILKILFYLYLCAGVQGVLQLTWLPCQFIDERVSVNEKNETNTELIHREAMLQFGQKGDAPLNPRSITFLVTGSKLDMRRYIEGKDQENLECELRKYSPADTHVRWPVQEPNDYNFWFSVTIKHANGLFALTSLLRQPSVQPSSSQDNRNRNILDGDVLTTMVVTVVKTQTPSLKAGIGVAKKLHCQFAVDHKGPNMTVEWNVQFHGERRQLFSHTGRTGHIEGRGVDLKSLAGGDASYTIPYTKATSKGSYICSVLVSPVFASVDISLQIEEPPRVTLNVGPVLTLTVGQDQKVTCEAGGYHPLDVDMVWHKNDPVVSGQRVGAPLPTVLTNTLLSSHKHNSDMTFAVTSFFYLTASLSDSGKEFTCIVAHQSLRMPIRKSFVLNVVEPTSWGFTLIVAVIIIVLLAVLLVMLRILNQGRRNSHQKKPY